MKPFIKNHFKREVIAMILVFVLPVLLGLLVAFVAPNFLRDIGIANWGQSAFRGLRRRT